MTRILYVDDDPIFLQLVRRRLGRAGFDIQHAGDADAALARLGAEDFEAVVLDHFLPSGTGRDVLHAMRAAGSSIPAVYVTGSSDASVAIEALKAGAEDYVIKGTGEEFLPLLERAIRQAIANAEMRAAREQAEAEVRAARDRAEALLGEVNHRVANSLAMVTSLLRLQAAASDSEELRTALSATRSRIAAIAGMHRSLYTGDDVRRVEMDRYLAALVRDLEATVPAGIRLVLQAAAVTLSSDRAVSVGIIVNELVTNAAKYAYPSGAGEVRIGLHPAGPDCARLTVSDDGIGTDPAVGPTGTGLGRRLVEAMAHSLDAQIASPPMPRGTLIEATIRLAPGAD